MPILTVKAISYLRSSLSVCGTSVFHVCGTSVLHVHVSNLLHSSDLVSVIIMFCNGVR